MKIDPTSISPIGSVQAVNRMSQVTRTKKSEQDQVAVSDTAQIFQKLTQKVKELPDIREDIVNDIAGKIARGEFSLDSESIAMSMLSPKRTEG